MQRAIDRAPHLRLVPPCGSCFACPPRLEVRISASDRRAPIGRTRLLRLTEPDFARLIDEAVRLEARR